MTATATTAAAGRERRDPLAPHELDRTIAMLRSVARTLESYVAGRQVTGSDAVLLRVTCARLGEVLAAVAHRGVES